MWFEDALFPYGVPTVVFDLHLLVPDPDEAARALIERGWTDAGLLNSTYHFLMGPVTQRRLHPPNYTPADQKSDTWPPPLPSQEPPGPTTTVLLPAADWNVPIEKLRPPSPDCFVPPLDLLVDALIDSYLDSLPGTVLQTRLTTYLWSLQVAQNTRLCGQIALGSSSISLRRAFTAEFGGGIFH